MFGEQNKNTLLLALHWQINRNLQCVMCDGKCGKNTGFLQNLLNWNDI